MTLLRIAIWVALSFLTSATFAQPDEPDISRDLKSGYHYSRPDTQAIQDDDFSNPGLIYVARGEQLWRRVEGKKQKSCASCHGNAASSMTSVGSTYPKIDVKKNQLINLSQRIQICRSEHMDAPMYIPPEHERENEDLLSLEVFIMAQSDGIPLSVSVTGAALPFFKLGRTLYHQRIGQSDLACSQCHDQRVGLLLRAERISQGHVNGFPAYILRWDRMASVHRRFQFCNEQARAQPLPLNHPDYNALQLYVAWRGQGLPIEIPSVRR